MTDAQADIPQTPLGPRDAIADAAMRLFGKHGYTGTSMRDIASAVGVLPGSLYAHIQSKEALLVDIVDDGIRRFLSAVKPVSVRDDSAADRLRAMILAHVQVVAQNPERSQVVFHQWRFLGPDNIGAAIEMRRRYEETFVSVIKDGVGEGQFRADLNVRIAVRTILGALNWTPEWLSPDGPMSVNEVGNSIADTLLSGCLL